MDLLGRYFYGQYKMGILNYCDVSITIRKTELSCNGLQPADSTFKEFFEYNTIISLDDIKGVELVDIRGKAFLVIKYTLNHHTIPKSIYFSGIDDLSECYSAIMGAIDNRAKDRQRMLEIKLAEEEKKRLYEIESQKFYDDCYNFHIKEGTKRFDILNDKNKLVTIYVDENKSLKFLQIDGYKKLEDVGVIIYEHIHYYDRAGAVYYISETNGSLSSTSGQFTGASISKSAVLTHGILFGALGLATAALMSYKPAQMTPSETHFNMKSEARRIDERSVILNYYSLDEKQFVDMELPQEIFNYLQTYLPDKKYDIVKEIERRSAINKVEVDKLPVSVKSKELPAGNMLSLDEFKEKVEKLKFMREAGLIDETEFDVEKKKLLQSI